MMKTEDWNETFRFDEEETELAQIPVETYEHARSEYTSVIPRRGSRVIS